MPSSGLLILFINDLMTTFLFLELLKGTLLTRHLEIRFSVVIGVNINKQNECIFNS